MIQYFRDSLLIFLLSTEFLSSTPNLQFILFSTYLTVCVARRITVKLISFQKYLHGSCMKFLPFWPSSLSQLFCFLFRENTSNQTSTFTCSHLICHLRPSFVLIFCLSKLIPRFMHPFSSIHGYNSTKCPFLFLRPFQPISSFLPVYRMLFLH